MRLLEHPASIPVLHAQRVRELHYWLLLGRHGRAIRRLGWSEVTRGVWRGPLRCFAPNLRNRFQSNNSQGPPE